MKRSGTSALAAAALFATSVALVICTALAQAPSPAPTAPQPQATSPRIDYGFPPRDYKRGEPPARGPATDLALEAAQRALAECSAKGFKVTAAVFDSAVQPVALLTATGALRIAPEAATRKAFVVLHTKQPSGDAAERVKTDLDFARQLAATGKALPVRGALPIRVGDEIIGAISVAGAPPPGDADEACARAGLDKIAARLK
jgi:uncharacterized protein GlcG (DUF336 family)